MFHKVIQEDMIDQILTDIAEVKSHGNVIGQIVLSPNDYKECFKMLPENTTLHHAFGYPTTISANNQSYILFTDQDNEQRHTNTGSSKPNQVGCE